MKINSNITPSLLNKFGKPVSKLTLTMSINFVDLADVSITDPTDQYSVVWDEALGKFTLANVEGIPNIPGQPGDTLYYSLSTGGEWLATNNLYNNGTNIGINNLVPEEKLEVGGNIKLSDYLIFSSTVDPTTIPENESYLYVTSEDFFNYGYSKAVCLKTMLETGEEVIISSSLI